MSAIVAINPSPQSSLQTQAPIKPSIVSHFCTESELLWLRLRDALVEALGQLSLVEVAADEHDLGHAALVLAPRLLGRRELDLVVHALEDKLRVALARERDDALGAVGGQGEG